MKFGEFRLYDTFLENDLITQDKYLKFAEENLDWIQFAKTDSLWNSFDWRGRHVERFIPQKPVVVFSHSDLSFKQQYADMIVGRETNAIFAVNAECMHKDVYGLPHGLTNDCHDTERHPILGNQQILFDILKTEKHPKHLVYMNFNTQTDIRRPNPIRKNLWDSFSPLQSIYKKECTDQHMNLLDRKQYLQDLYDSKFVLCPEGNGIDTVRVWEALYCRTIPIVQINIAMRYFNELPILWVNNWGECMDPNYLEMQYNRIMNSEWNLDMLKIGYWEEKMKEVYKESVK